MIFLKEDYMVVLLGLQNKEAIMPKNIISADIEKILDIVKNIKF
jgi:hypothetical protein